MIISIKMWMKRMMGGSLGGGGSFGQNKRGLECSAHLRGIIQVRQEGGRGCLFVDNSQPGSSCGLQPTDHPMRPGSHQWSQCLLFYFGRNYSSYKCRKWLKWKWSNFQWHKSLGDEGENRSRGRGGRSAQTNKAFPALHSILITTTIITTIIIIISSTIYLKPLWYPQLNTNKSHVFWSGDTSGFELKQCSYLLEWIFIFVSFPIFTWLK